MYALVAVIFDVSASVAVSVSEGGQQRLTTAVSAPATPPATTSGDSGNPALSAPYHLCPAAQVLCESKRVCVRDCGRECAEDGVFMTASSRDTCTERHLFKDRDTNTMVWNLFALFIWFFVAGLTMAAGVGGGGIYVSLGLLIMGLSTKHAVALSQASICGASLAGLFLNSRRRHPLDKDKPLIDLNVVRIMAPVEIVGSMCGIALQQMLPEW